MEEKEGLPDGLESIGTYLDKKALKAACFGEVPNDVLIDAVPCRSNDNSTVQQYVVNGVHVVKLVKSATPSPCSYPHHLNVLPFNEAYQREWGNQPICGRFVVVVVGDRAYENIRCSLPCGKCE